MAILVSSMIFFTNLCKTLKMILKKGSLRFLLIRFTVFLLILNRDRDRCRPWASLRFFITMAIVEHFSEDAHGRDGHGHASKLKETL